MYMYSALRSSRTVHFSRLSRVLFSLELSRVPSPLPWRFHMLYLSPLQFKSYYTSSSRSKTSVSVYIDYNLWVWWRFQHRSEMFNTFSLSLKGYWFSANSCHTSLRRFEAHRSTFSLSLIYLLKSSF